MDMGTAGTIEAWVWSEGVDGMVFNKWREIQEDKQLVVLGGGVSGFAWDGGAGGYVDSGTCVLPEGAWAHAAFVWDGTGRRIYVDGELCGSDSVVLDVRNSTGPAHIGGIYRDSQQVPPMQGFLRQVRLSGVARYSTDFTPADLSTDADTLALWALDEAAGTSAADGSGNGNTGTISGATWAPVPCTP
ncbi:MAG: LamG domain-containing protein [Myxococcales bacterium]|nr:LamG domain-containing protein [Myxococcales bacterium]